MIAGVDFGSKLSGQTVVAILDNDIIQVQRSEKGKDADDFLLGVLEATKITLVGIDAPLSLPGLYLGNGSDYFFREADRDLGAMSPMFLGGLTARAIRIRDKLVMGGKNVIEVYPAIKILELGCTTDDEPEMVIQKMLTQNHWSLNFTGKWDAHTRDSILALMSAHAYNKGDYKSFGNKEEGMIYV